MASACAKSARDVDWLRVRPISVILFLIGLTMLITRFACKVYKMPYKYMSYAHSESPNNIKIEAQTITKLELKGQMLWTAY